MKKNDEAGLSIKCKAFHPRALPTALGFLFLILFLGLTASCTRQLVNRWDENVPKGELVEGLVVPESEIGEMSEELRSLHSRPGWSGPGEGEPDAASKISTAVFGTPAFAQEAKPKIIFTGEISVRVQKLADAADRVIKLLPEFGGYLSERTDVTTGSVQSISMRVRVRNERLQAFTDELKKLGEVLKYNVAGQEVTEEYMDLEARLKQLKLSEERLLEIMRKSGKLTDLLEVERELTNKQSEIERIQGRLRYLSDRVAMATLSIMLVTEAPPMQIGGFTWGFGDTFKSAWLALKTTVREFVKALIWIVVYAPVWILSLLILWLLFLIGRKVVHTQVTAYKKKTVER